MIVSISSSAKQIISTESLRAISEQELDRLTTMTRLASAVGLTLKPSISQLIRMSMAQKNLNAGETARLAKVSRKQLGDVLNDDNILPNKTTLKKLSVIFGDEFLEVSLMLRKLNTNSQE